MGDRTSGTNEWADSNINWCYGCSHNCHYCYAKFMAKRFKRIKNLDEWKEMRLNQKAIDKGYAKRSGRVMMPTSHDITPEILDPSIKILRKVLAAGNQVLITTKPHFDCIVRICNELLEYKEQIQFRFTIGSYTTRHFEIWEPNAPTFRERLDSLKYAYKKGFKTSVSAEPLLTNQPMQLITTLREYITESLWFGLMNHVRKLPQNIKHAEHYNKKIEWIRDNVLLWVKDIEQYKERHKDHKYGRMIRYKDSIRQILEVNCKGRQEAKQTGLEAFL